MVNFSEWANAGYAKMVELYNAMPSKQEVKQKVDAAITYATPYVQTAVNIVKPYAEVAKQEVMQKVNAAYTNATPYVQTTLTAIKPYAVLANKKTHDSINSVTTFFQEPVAPAKLTKISNKVLAVNAQIEELKKAVLLMHREGYGVADALSLQSGIADLEYNSQKILRSLEKIKDRAPAEHKANRKLLKMAVEGLCETISKEGHKAITTLQVQAQEKLQQIREGRESLTIADQFDLKMVMNKLEQTEALISGAHKRIDALRKEIFKA